METHISVAGSGECHLEIMEPGSTDGIEPVHHFLVGGKAKLLASVLLIAWCLSPIRLFSLPMCILAFLSWT